MKKSLASLVALAVCALSLVTASAPAAHAQTGDQVVLAGRADADPWVIAFTDTGGRSQINEPFGKSVQQSMAGSDWSITANGVLTISKEGKQVLQIPCLGNEAKTWFLVHGRNGAAGVEGTVVRFRDEPAKGFAILWINQPSQDGKSVYTAYVEVDLTYPTTGTGNTGGGTGGFGNFGS